MGSTINHCQLKAQKKIFLYKQRSTRNGKFVEKNYSFSGYTDLWSLVKKIYEGKLSIKEARKQQNAMKKG